MSSYSDSDDDSVPRSKLFGRRRPIHDIFGGGRVADILLWKDKKMSAGLLLGMTVLWFLFEVVEYNFVTLICHISITSMLIFFIWNPPRFPEAILKESTFKDVASTLHRRINQFLIKIFDIAYGKDLPLFFLAIVSLYLLSVIGSYISFLNLLYFGFVALETLPFLYEKYEEEVDQFAGKAISQTKKSYRNFDAKFLNKIPRGPVKDKKLR
ncbi:reticulon-like protein B9 [Cucumis melo var. makuwa]|uniref:Reticulon-like protein n=1 Tax=Cucumis melo var. makuwa TaxID=1194695 RepID=A0A5D3BGX3_CUCMM|nr:reticulon-like protein B9 [Cucumis melo var. makuwa]